MEDDARYRRLAAPTTLVNVMLLQYNPPGAATTTPIPRQKSTALMTHRR